MSERDTDEMYVGYLEKAPGRYHRSVRNAVLTIGIILTISALTIGYYQRAFNNGNFEFGQLTEVSGRLSKTPFPILITGDGEAILLVGFGKAGALGTLEHMENIHGNTLEGTEVTMRGTLIYGEGKILMELTEGEKALITAGVPMASRLPEFKMAEKKQISGEIIDPKCYFGVMKPAEGKVHRSCAIRCVSGGIPPVLKVISNNDDLPEFYLLEGVEGERINADVLNFIGDHVLLEGVEYALNDDWRVLRVDAGSFARIK